MRTGELNVHQIIDNHQKGTTHRALPANHLPQSSLRFLSPGTSVEQREES